MQKTGFLDQGFAQKILQFGIKNGELPPNLRSRGSSAVRKSFSFFLVALALKKMYFMGKKVVYELYSIERFVGIPLWDAQRR